MARLFLVQDGILDVGYKTLKGIQVKNSNYYLITYNFETNEGYIDKKEIKKWRLYTQVGQKFAKKRYHHFQTFDECLEKLKELKGDEEIIVCNSSEIEKYK
ncbi:hypothetical protein [Tenacibaculum maritimum]|uniref:hypothetical protein n=1 Tax=Tenacibaculum maritimum TaxID=107401 RepID=UPI001E4B8137|nr:hypothetical protein [Tenacibaculum maritimum]MCD9564269.1 hypothetical protein [Tenacibaculum maritimum]MCD9567062.1 hypothetical protein [Tenacibaculum maritimum]MCD9578802.1 hypothetical protein [Tenacibaculum maritimum]MCD9598023.1 hypothetical protein [Tenacibaculum maritimum]MCD9614932.1 hypothetical protein [Tenacibaculum maritimum]